MLAPTNPNATQRAQNLYRLLQEHAGKRILLAQQETPARERHEQEMEHIYRVTGRLPAIRGLDFIGDDFAGVIDRSRAWNERGGIVTICWHTGIIGRGYPESQSESPDFTALLTEGSELNKLLLSRWDAAAKALLTLQQEDIPVLWRPFHEFDGGWFWWGKGRKEDFICLWQRMNRIFTEDYGLKNLLWVLGYADHVPDGWYPGDAYCDVLGSDTYKGVTTHAASYRRLKNIHGGKPLAFHECGLLPEPDRFFSDGATWSYIMPWHSKWLIQDNPEERLLQVYRDERMLCLDNIPEF